MMKWKAVVMLVMVMGCGSDSVSERITRPAASPMDIGCWYSTEKGIYSAIHKDEAYLVINMTTTGWISETNKLVLKINTQGPPEVEGVQTTLIFGPQDMDIRPTSVRVEFDLADVGATEHADGSPSFWVRAESQDGCFVGSFWVPFGHGAP